MRLLKYLQYVVIAAILLISPLLASSVSIHDTTVKLIANVLPVLLAYCLAFGLLRRPWGALLITLAICLFLTSAHTLKLQHLNQPLKFADAFLATQTITNWNLMSEYAPKGLWVYLALGLLALTTLWKLERPVRWFWAPPILVIALGGFYLISNKAFSPDMLYGPKAHGAKPWDTESVASEQGLFASLITDARSARLNLPEPDSQQIDAFFSEHSNLPTATNPQLKPDIILWLGESFFNPSIIAGVEPCQWLNTYCELANHGLTSVIDIPTFGGNTTRTEFEVLTGVPFSLLGTKDYPYMSAVHGKHNSIAWELTKLGYQTTALHPNRETMWQRNRAIPLLGFQTFQDIERFRSAKRDGLWISDAALAQRVKDTIDKKDSPQFVLAISMEGHGPFDTQKVLNQNQRDAISSPDFLSEKAAQQWREYIYHAQNSLKALEQLKAFMDQRERPTLLVFFGDHLPNLKKVFKNVSFKDGRGDWQQDTPVLALANYPIQSEWRPEASHQLGVWTLELAGVSSASSYHQLQQALVQNYKHSARYKDVVLNLQIEKMHAPAE